MILRPKNREELIAQLKALPEHQRRVIILVGRHPNEGTTNIARRHHKSWEEHGAVVVRIPGQWTPHGFWKKHGERQDSVKVRELAAKVPDDRSISSQIQLEINKGFIIHFHGTPSQKSGLQLISSRLTAATKTALTSIVEGNAHLSDAHPADPDMLIEYFFGGDATVTKIKVNPKIYLNGHIPEHINTLYLTQNRINRQALQEFDDKYAKTLTTVIKHISDLVAKKKRTFALI
ncbi:MAG: hypothetical protein V1722_01375 [Candidatus Micrarchaeota archaeon]